MACQKPARKQGRRFQNRALPDGRASDRVGGTERTRTVIGLIDNQVPHLSATVPNKFGVTCGVEPSSLHSQCSVLTDYTKATARLVASERLELSNVSLKN